MKCSFSLISLFFAILKGIKIKEKKVAKIKIKSNMKIKFELGLNEKPLIFSLLSDSSSSS